MATQDETNRDLAVSFWTSFTNRDRQAYSSLITDDCVLKIGIGGSEGTVPYHGTFSGRAQIDTWLDTVGATRKRVSCKQDPTGADIPVAANLMSGPGIVCGTGTVVDQFVDGTPMCTSEFALVLHIDEQQNKIKGVQWFMDTAAVLLAWQARPAAATP